MGAGISERGEGDVDQRCAGDSVASGGRGDHCGERGTGAVVVVGRAPGPKGRTGRVGATGMAGETGAAGVTGLAGAATSNGSFWGLSGNTGTVAGAAGSAEPGVNYLGTNDAENLEIRLAGSTGRFSASPKPVGWS